MNNQWSLFGFDLTRVWDYMRLGVRQLLLGFEAGIRQRCYPEIPVISLSDAAIEEFSLFGLRAEGARDGGNCAVVISDDLVLFKTMELPVQSELELDAVMYFEATTSSPFPQDDTVFGWRIVSRSEAILGVALAISSRSAIAELSLAHDYLRAIPSTDMEVWSGCEGVLIQFQGFGENDRDADYRQRLIQGAAWSVFLVLGVYLLLSIPAAAIQMRAGQLQELAAETELTAGVATESRNRLIILETKISAAGEYFEERLNLQESLDNLAKATPDSVYFTRLSLDEGRLTITGLADNAAEYQTLLASAKIVTELSAPAAFTRNSRAQKERFTLTMRIDGGNE